MRREMLIQLLRVGRTRSEMTLSPFLVGRSVLRPPLCDAHDNTSVCGISGIRGGEEKTRFIAESVGSLVPE